MPPKKNTNNSDNRGLSTEEVQQMISDRIGQAFPDGIPENNTNVQNTMMEMFATFTATFLAQQHQLAVQPRTREYLYCDFSACSPPEFYGDVIDPVASLDWLKDVSRIFRSSECPEDKQVKFAILLLRGTAKKWWADIEATLSAAEISEMTWTQFSALFEKKFAPKLETVQIVNEFLYLQQTTESVYEITRKFNDFAVFCPTWVADEQWKINRYIDMLHPDIKTHLCFTKFSSFDEVCEAARRVELNFIQISKKRNVSQTSLPPPSFPLNSSSSSPISKKKQRNFEHRQNLKKFGKKVVDDYKRCSRCGVAGHDADQCMKDRCYQCGQPGHFAVDCPLKAKAKFVAAPPARARVHLIAADDPDTMPLDDEDYEVELA